MNRRPDFRIIRDVMYPGPRAIWAKPRPLFKPPAERAPPREGPDPVVFRPIPYHVLRKQRQAEQRAIEKRRRG